MSDNLWGPSVQVQRALGSKDAGDFAEQQGKLLPNNAPARGTEPARVADDNPAEVQESTADDKEQGTETNELVATTPPPNDSQDRELYAGDREVVFVGAYFIQISAVGLHLRCE